MAKRRYFILFGWLLVLLSGCTLTLQLEPPWRTDNLQLHRHSNQSGPQEPATPSPAIMTTDTITVEIPAIVDLPAGHINNPFSVLAISPLTEELTVSVTSVVTTVVFGSHCTITDVLPDLLDYSGAPVRAAIVRSVADESVVGSAYDPTAQRTIYWQSDDASGEPRCTPAPWLWHQSLLSPVEDGVAHVEALALPASDSCVMPAMNLAVFGSFLDEKQLWPDQLLVQPHNLPPTLLILQHTATCNSGDGCDMFQSVCSEIFEDGSWRQWCTSLCQ